MAFNKKIMNFNKNINGRFFVTTNDQTVDSEEKYQYSFTKDFQQYSYANKVLTMIFLPLLPILIVSKGFQMRAWKNEGSELPPSARKYYIRLGLIYIITIYPIGITLLYFAIQLNGWFIFYPLAFLIAYYFLRKDYAKEEIQHGTKSDEFQVIGFKKLSFTFLFLLLFTLIFTLGGALLLLTITSLIFILFPKLYKKLYFIPSKFLILSMHQVLSKRN